MTNVYKVTFCWRKILRQVNSSEATDDQRSWRSKPKPVMLSVIPITWQSNIHSITKWRPKNSVCVNPLHVYLVLSPPSPSSTQRLSTKLHTHNPMPLACDITLVLRFGHHPVGLKYRYNFSTSRHKVVMHYIPKTSYLDPPRALDSWLSTPELTFDTQGAMQRENNQPHIRL